MPELAPPIKLLFGEEDFLLEARLAELLETVVPESARDFNQDVFLAEEVQPEAVFRLASSYPVLCDQRLVVLKGMERASAALLRDLEKYSRAPSPSTCLVLCCAKPDKRKSLWKKLVKAPGSEEFSRPSVHELPEWMSRRLAGEGIELPREIARSLAMHLEGAGLRQVSGEMEKLSLLVQSDGRNKVEDEDLATVLGMPANYSVWNLIDAVFARDARVACGILKELLQLPSMEFMLTGAMARSFGRAWLASQFGSNRAEMTRALGLRGDWQAGNLLKQIRGWQPASLSRASRMIRDTDMDLKGGGALPAKVRLSQLVVELCRC